MYQLSNKMLEITCFATPGEPREACKQNSVPKHAECPLAAGAASRGRSDRM
jgi:hypothetical protein